MGVKLDQILKLQRQQIELTTELIKRVEKLIAVNLSTQLLTECIAPDGNPRTADQVAELVTESFCGALCISNELNPHQKGFDYQVSEFFIEDEEEQEDEYEEEEDDDDDRGFIPPDKSPMGKF
jgi:hypothetical protein